MTRRLVLFIGLTLAGCREAPATRAPEPEPPPAPAMVATPSGRLPGAEARPIEIPAGQTSAAIEGRLAPERHDEFVAGGRKDALLIAELIAPDTGLRLNVYRMDTGQQLPDDDPRASAWKGHLPVTAGYLFEVEGATRESAYTLKLDMPTFLTAHAPAITDLGKGLTTKQVEDILGPPIDTPHPQASGSQFLVEREYLLNGQKITARYVSGILLNYTMTDREKD